MKLHEIVYPFQTPRGGKPDKPHPPRGSGRHRAEIYHEPFKPSRRSPYDPRGPYDPGNVSTNCGTDVDGDFDDERASEMDGLLSEDLQTYYDEDDFSSGSYSGESDFDDDDEDDDDDFEDDFSTDGNTPRDMQSRAERSRSRSRSRERRSRSRSRSPLRRGNYRREDGHRRDYGPPRVASDSEYSMRRPERRPMIKRPSSTGLSSKGSRAKVNLKTAASPQNTPVKKHSSATSMKTSPKVAAPPATTRAPAKQAPAASKPPNPPPPPPPKPNPNPPPKSTPTRPVPAATSALTGSGPKAPAAVTKQTAPAPVHTQARAAPSAKPTTQTPQATTTAPKSPAATVPQQRQVPTPPSNKPAAKPVTHSPKPTQVPAPSRESRPAYVPPKSTTPPAYVPPKSTTPPEYRYEQHDYSWRNPSPPYNTRVVGTTNYVETFPHAQEDPSYYGHNHYYTESAPGHYDAYGYREYDRREERAFPPSLGVTRGCSATSWLNVNENARHEDDENLNENARPDSTEPEQRVAYSPNDSTVVFSPENDQYLEDDSEALPTADENQEEEEDDDDEDADDVEDAESSPEPPEDINRSPVRAFLEDMFSRMPSYHVMPSITEE